VSGPQGIGTTLGDLAADAEQPVDSDEVEDFADRPRWVKVFAAVAVGVVVVYVVLALVLAGPGEHGPARHGAQPEDPRRELGAGVERSAVVAAVTVG
jgi:hypothetical protein